MNNLRGVNPAETPGMCDWKAGVRQAEKSQMAPKMIFSSVPRNKCHLASYVWTSEDGRVPESCLHPDTTREKTPDGNTCTHLPPLTLPVPVQFSNSKIDPSSSPLDPAQRGLNGSPLFNLPLPSNFYTNVDSHSQRYLKTCY